METDINDHFAALTNDLQLSEGKTTETPHEKSVYYVQVSFALSVSSRLTSRQIKETRVFVPRNSILTDLFEISHIQTVRNVFAAILIILVLQETVQDIINEGRQEKSKRTTVHSRVFRLEWIFILISSSNALPSYISPCSFG